METTEKKVSHTPGPWRVYTPSIVPFESLGIDSNISSSPVLYGGDGDRYCGVRGRTKEEMTANAKLIAAAPEMLEVLKEADAWLSFNQRPDADQIRVFRKSIQEVIKKASE